MLTLAYMTGRKDSKIDWFWDSLKRQGIPDRVVIVDRHFEKDHPTFWKSMDLSGCEVVHTAPKPTVWQGKHRLTKEEYFAAANARNTAICYALDGHIAFVDDLSVLLPGWLDCVRQSMAENYIALGAYKKVKKLVVENGEVKSFEEFPGGVDSRLRSATGDQTSCGGSWLFGCSFAMPVEAYLSVNGSDENCDSTGLGSEDYCLGIRIGNTNKYSFRYDRRMMTYESEEHHHIEAPLKRMDKGVSPNDKSHAILNAVMGSTWAPNYFGDGGLRALREKILNGEDFPVTQIPAHDWYDKQPLSEL